MIENLEYKLTESFEGPEGDNTLFGTITGKNGFMAWYNLYIYPNENTTGKHIGFIRLQIIAGHLLKHNTFLILAVEPVKEKGQIGFQFVKSALRKMEKRK